MSPAQALARELTDALGSNAVVTDAADKAAYESDWRGLVAHPASLVVLPRTTADVQAVVRLCSAYKAQIVPQGGNTSLVAGAVPTPGRSEVIVNLRRLNRIREVDLANNTLIAEAGAVLDAVRTRAAEVGRLFPLSLAAEGSCQIGGNVATNAGGVQVLSYGSMRNLVLGLEVVLADGVLWDGLRVLRKDNTGLDIKQLFIGSEGTLGIITAAALRLVPRPKAVLTFLAGVPDPEAALRLFVTFQERYGGELTSFEYFEPLAISLALARSSRLRVPFEAAHPGYVLVELSALEAARDLGAGAEPLLADAANAEITLDAVIATTETQRRNLWALRESLSEGERAAGGAIKHDVSVPITAIPATVRQIRLAIEAVAPGARLNVFGHLGDGNLHVNVMPPQGVSLADFVAAGAPVSDAIHDLATSARGSFSAEHGVGQLRKSALLKWRPQLDIHLMRGVKRALDPEGLFNPGKIFD